MKRRILATLAIVCALTITGCVNDSKKDDNISQVNPDKKVELPKITIENKYPVTLEPTKILAGNKLKIKYSGKLKDSETLKVYYGFNGLNELADATDLKSVVGGLGNLDYYKEEDMSKKDGTFDIEVNIPKSAKSLNLYFYTLDQAGKKILDNNDGYCYNYNTDIGFPYIGPYLTWNKNMSYNNGIVVSFETSYFCKAFVEYGETENLGTVVVEDNSTKLHHIELNGLKEDKKYYYRVYGDNNDSSKIYSFKTGKTDTPKMKFLVISDMQENGEDNSKNVEGRRWNEIVSQIEKKHMDVDFIVSAGDVFWDNYPWHWWSFFDKGRELLANKVMMAVPGNHDNKGMAATYDTSDFRKFFTYPYEKSDNSYYSFRYGKADFVCLNSEIKAEFTSKSGIQYAYVKERLKQEKNEWMFSMWHIPPYNIASKHYQQQFEFRDITELFNGKMDWVFTGHEHMYIRTKPSRYNGVLASKYGNGENDGVGYISLPPAGNWPENTIITTALKNNVRDLIAFPDLTGVENKIDSQVGYVIVEIDGKSINIKVYGMGTLEKPSSDVVLIDEVNYTK